VLLAGPFGAATGAFAVETGFFEAGAGFAEAVVAGLAPDGFAPGCGVGLEVCPAASAAVAIANANV
jgi:hypothetical protein